MQMLVHLLLFRGLLDYPHFFSFFILFRSSDLHHSDFHSHTAPTPHAGEPPILGRASLAQSHTRTMTLFPEFWYTQDSVSASMNGICFPWSCEIPVTKLHWPSKPDSLGLASLPDPRLAA